MIRIVIASVAGLLFCSSVLAESIADRLVGTGTAADTVDWTRSALEALPQTTVETTTIWTEGMQTFVGPTLHSVLAASDIDAADGVIRATAANGYFVDFPIAEIAADFPVVAVKRNGTYFDLRENGPLWIVYPYDAGHEFQIELLLSRSIWQLVSITVVN